MRRAICFVILLSLVGLGCTTTQRGAAVGGAAGAGLGAIIGHQSGHTAEGAGIGAAVGAVTGAVVADKMQTKYCPVCGNRYTSDVKYCPLDGAELKEIKNK